MVQKTDHWKLGASYDILSRLAHLWASVYGDDAEEQNVRHSRPIIPTTSQIKSPVQMAALNLCKVACNAIFTIL